MCRPCAVAGGLLANTRPPVRLSRFGTAATAAWSRVNVPEPRACPLPYDFAYGRSDLATFPFEKWWASLVRSARHAPVADLDYSVAGGSLALREGICAHLRRSRAVNCDPSQVIIVNGSQQAGPSRARADQLGRSRDRAILPEAAQPGWVRARVFAVEPGRDLGGHPTPGRRSLTLSADTCCNRYQGPMDDSGCGEHPVASAHEGRKLCREFDVVCLGGGVGARLFRGERETDSSLEFAIRVCICPRVLMTSGLPLRWAQCHPSGCWSARSPGYSPECHTNASRWRCR